MSAPVITFQSAVAARRERGGVSIALMDARKDATNRTCTAILLCSDEAARGLAHAIRAMRRAEKS